jgi:hypothetical protein
MANPHNRPRTFARRSTTRTSKIAGRTRTARRAQPPQGKLEPSTVIHIDSLPRPKRRYAGLLNNLIASGLIVWPFFFDERTAATPPPGDLAKDTSFWIQIVALVVAISLATSASFRGSRKSTLGALIFLLTALVMVFVTTYYRVGDGQNFQPELTKADALYFTLGTLTTAGTGSITPISDYARLLVSCQMIINSVFTVWVVTIAVERLSNSMAARTKQRSS